MIAVSRRSHMRSTRLFLAALMLTACSNSSPTPTRLVGAHRMALAVPADWKTGVERGAFCAAIEPETVLFFAPLRPHEGVGSCGVPKDGSWPAQDSVSVFTDAAGGVYVPRGASRSGTVHGIPYYIYDSRQTGPGVAMTLSVPSAGVMFLVGAADRDTAQALLSTLRYVPAGTQLR